ncbi:MerR family transcriptional regulator [Pseudaminobacter sp. NGMCC 1.201702]
MPVPARTEGNYRTYPKAHLNRLSFIRRTLDLGFPVTRSARWLEIRAMSTPSTGLKEPYTSAERSAA